MRDPASFATEGLDLLSIGIGLFDSDLRLIRANPQFRELRQFPDALCQAGVSLETLLRFNADRGDFGPGDPAQLTAERLTEIEQAGERTVEREMADGQILGITYRRTGSGGLVMTFEDRTAERRAQAALEASEQRYALLSEAAEEAIYEWDVAGRQFYASPRLKTLIGRDFDASGERRWGWDEIIHLDDLPGYQRSLDDHLSGRVALWRCEYRLRDAGGAWRWVSDHGTSIRDDNGRAIRMVAAIRDITDIREARAEIDRTAAQLTSSLATISDGILLVDGNNRVQIWNDRYFEIFTEASGGADLTGVIVKDRPFFDMIRDGYNLGMFKPHPDGVDAWVKARAQAWERPVAQWELELANGTWILLNERQMADGGRVSVYTDITKLKRREADAQTARVKFEEAIEAMTSGFVLWDAEDRLVVCNTRYKKYFPELADTVIPGTPFSQIIRAAMDRGLFPDAEVDPEAFLSAVVKERAIAKGHIREQRMAAGLRLQISDHRTADGGMVSVYTDVTELRNREDEFQRQTAILELTLENMGQGITMVDKNLRTVAFNRKFFELMEFPEQRFGNGFTMEEAFRYNAERGEYGLGDVEEQVRSRLALAGEFKAHRFERTRPDGTVLEIVGNPMDGGGLVATYTDITERKRADGALKKALAEFNTVLDRIDYGVLFTGPDLRARIVNRAMSRIWKIPQAYFDSEPHMREIIERVRETGLYKVAPEDWDAWLDERIQQIEDGDIPAREFERADGSVVTYQCVALPDGGRMLTYFDITELKEREADISRARDEAEAALVDLKMAQTRLVQAEKMASLGQLTAGIAHEIKNPLNFVNNFAKLSNGLLVELAEILEQPIKALDDETRDDAEDLLETVRGNLAKIDEHGRRADSIVKNMLLHSREGPSELQRVNINAIAEEALNLAYHGARAENPQFNIEMHKTMAPDMGEVECFPQDLMRVFLNLISNGMYAASKAAAEGVAPEITLTSRTDGDRIQIEVRDNGGGIPTELLEKIFTPFFTTKPAGEGTGLGLSLSYDIVVKQHGGELTVDSQPGAYTAFRVTLPRNPPITEGAQP